MFIVSLVLQFNCWSNIAELVFSIIDNNFDGSLLV